MRFCCFLGIINTGDYMYNQDVLNKINEEFNKKRLLFTKEEMNYNSGRNTRSGFLHGIFSSSYWHRDRLIKNGSIIYGWTFKSYMNDFTGTKGYPTWVLFSPSSCFQQDPSLYEKIYDKTKEILMTKPKTKKEKHLKSILENNLDEPTYFEIPEPYNLGYLCFISVCYVRPYHFSNFHLGVNLIISALEISKEIVYLPQQYWSEEFKETYYKEELK